MYNQIQGEALFLMLYAIVTAIAALGSCYLLFRRGNAFAADVRPPLPLRHWTAALLAVICLNHLWYMPILFLSKEADILLCDLLGGLLDSMTFFPLSVIVMFKMLQDRQRPLWPVFVAFAPLMVASAWCVVTRSYDFLFGYVYFVLLCIALIIYMVHEVRRYGRWLRDNYADLEHKEVWQSMVLLGVLLLGFVFYALAGEGIVYVYVLHLVSLVLVLYLLWRVETLSVLNGPDSSERTDILSNANYEKIESLLKQHCIDTGLYLQHGLTLTQLAKSLGTNRTYLSMYFSHQKTTYNTYVNTLRIDHFLRLYSHAVASGQPVSAMHLAGHSGYRNYSTFSLAFKQRMGQSVKEWMAAENAQTTE